MDKELKSLIYFYIFIVFVIVIVSSFKSNAALSESGCASLIVTNLKSENNKIDATEETRLTTYWTAICKGILDHIKTSGVVTTTVNGVTGSGTPGGPLPIVAQPGTGTIQ